MQQVYIALGSNLGEREKHISDALDSLEGLAEATQVEPELPESGRNSLVQRSALYASDPMGPTDQPAYVNAVCRFSTSLAPHSLLSELQRIEGEHDRVRGDIRWGARTLDLDLLLYGKLFIDTPALVVPHPGMAMRSFVLMPLADLDPELVVPGLGPISELLQKCQQFGIRRLHSESQAI